MVKIIIILMIDRCCFIVDIHLDEIVINKQIQVFITRYCINMKNYRKKSCTFV